METLIGNVKPMRQSWAKPDVNQEGATIIEKLVKKKYLDENLVE